MMFYKARQLLMKKWSYRTKVPSMGPAPTLDCSEEPFWSRMSNVSRPGESSSWPSNKVEDWLESKLEPFCIYNRIFFPELWTCSFMKRERNIAQGKYRAEWESHKQEYRQLVHVRGVPTVVTAKTPLELQQKVGEITGTNGPAFAASTALAPANAPTGPSASMIPRDSRLGLGARYGGLVRRNSVGEGQRVDKQH